MLLRLHVNNDGTDRWSDTRPVLCLYCYGCGQCSKLVISLQCPNTFVVCRDLSYIWVYCGLGNYPWSVVSLLFPCLWMCVQSLLVQVLYNCEWCSSLTFLQICVHLYVLLGSYFWQRTVTSKRITSIARFYPSMWVQHRLQVLVYCHIVCLILAWIDNAINGGTVNEKADYGRFCWSKVYCPCSWHLD